MEFYNFSKTDFKILMSLSGFNHNTLDKTLNKPRVLSTTPFQATCLEMLAIEYHEIHMLNGYIDFKVIDNEVWLKEVSFFKDDIDYQVSNNFISHVTLLLESFIHYHETLYQKADLHGALLIVNDGYPSVAWF